MGCQLIYLYYCLIFRGKARDRRHNDQWHENGRTSTPGQPLLEPESQPAPEPIRLSLPLSLRACLILHLTQLLELRPLLRTIEL